ncbi:hypothetical protein HYFRA_00006907 [Hymenoscyphus fraxineus]|uniref:Uncharacterized protein n=1 Tax=Hymenoscyphus fraxineus TaxID=746836 RepID=A0A9N9KMD3_9HELO|nr:hypothetical protein HYFRA_00006907 [Hymenoscyphus fraxineus]
MSIKTHQITSDLNCHVAIQDYFETQHFQLGLLVTTASPYLRYICLPSRRTFLTQYILYLECWNCDLRFFQEKSRDTNSSLHEVTCLRNNHESNERSPVCHLVLRNYSTTVPGTTPRSSAGRLVGYPAMAMHSTQSGVLNDHFFFGADVLDGASSSVSFGNGNSLCFS